MLNFQYGENECSFNLLSGNIRYFESDFVTSQDYILIKYYNWEKIRISITISMILKRTRRGRHISKITLFANALHPKNQNLSI